MNASRTLTSLIAAATIVGTVGFAYAQTTTESTTQVTPSTTQAAPAPMAPAQDTLSAPSSTAPSDSSATELTPKADRN